MTLEDVDWLLRMPSDELQMSPETLAQVQSAIANAKTLAEGIKYRETRDDAGRQVKIPYTLADRKLTVIPSTSGLVSIYVRGVLAVAVYFAAT